MYHTALPSLLQAYNKSAKEKLPKLCGGFFKENTQNGKMRKKKKFFKKSVDKGSDLLYNSTCAVKVQGREKAVEKHLKSHTEP
jgi:hypothetical protein